MIDTAKLRRLATNAEIDVDYPSESIAYEKCKKWLMDNAIAIADEIDRLRGAILAQDNRERAAGERCGVDYNLYGCDWPDAAAEEIDRLRGEVHDCPKCGMACKQCECFEQQLAAARHAEKMLPKLLKLAKRVANLSCPMVCLGNCIVCEAKAAVAAQSQEDSK